VINTMCRGGNAPAIPIGHTIDRASSTSSPADDCLQNIWLISAISGVVTHEMTAQSATLMKTSADT